MMAEQAAVAWLPSYSMTGSERPSSRMTLTDEELVSRSRSGDTESFNQLVLRWERPIYALAYRVIGREEEARDVCQDTFLRAYRALPGFKGQAKFSSWLYRIALNLCRDWIRKQQRAPVSHFHRIKALRELRDRRPLLLANPVATEVQRNPV